MSTVNSINAVQSLGIQGFINVDHQVPPGASVKELKTCENCGRPFVRTRPARYCTPEGRTLGQRHCVGCNKRYLLPPEDKDYRDMLPTSAEMAHRSYLPRYDNSMLAGDAPRRGRKVAWWRAVLIRKFQEKGVLSAKEIGVAIEADNYAMARLTDFPYTMVGHVWPRVGRGQPAALYALKENA